MPERGSIADISARLARWGRIAPHGLARVEFISEFSRQRVVAELRHSLQSENIPFYEIELPLQTPAAQIVTDLKSKFQSLEPGVVSLSGFETAFPDDVPLADSLRLFNFNRENLADYPLRQIWWMTPPFAQEFIHATPDLNSWFIVKLRLEEAWVNREEVACLVEPSVEESLPADEAHRLADFYCRRFQNALWQPLPAWELLQIALLAVETTLLGGEKEQALQLQQMLFDRMFLEGKSVDTIIDEEVGTYSQGQHKARIINDLAFVYYLEENYAQAETLYLLALSIAGMWMPQDGEFIARVMLNLANVYRRTERYTQSETLLQQAIEIRAKILGQNSPQVATAFSNLAMLYFNMRRYADAEERHRVALAITTKSLGEEHPDTCFTVRYYRYFLCCLGRKKEAEVLNNRYHIES